MCLKPNSTRRLRLLRIPENRCFKIKLGRKSIILPLPLWGIAYALPQLSSTLALREVMSIRAQLNCRNYGIRGAQSPAAPMRASMFECSSEPNDNVYKSILSK